MKKSFLFIGIVSFLLVMVSFDKPNVTRGLESVNVTWVKIINVGSVSYTDNSGGFRIKNITSDTIKLMVQMRDNPDTMFWYFTPGWNPEVVKSVRKNAGNTDSIIYIGK